MIPENLQDRNVRRFKGFTPQQVEKLLAGKGFKPNSREVTQNTLAQWLREQKRCYRKSSP